MTKQVWKFPILRDRQIEMPEGADIITLMVQDGTACIWAIVDTEAPKVKRTFLVVGTGHDIPENCLGWYWGSWQSGPFVWHLFEER